MCLEPTVYQLHVGFTGTGQPSKICYQQGPQLITDNLATSQERVAYQQHLCCAETLTGFIPPTHVELDAKVSEFRAMLITKKGPLSGAAVVLALLDKAILDADKDEGKYKYAIALYLSKKWKASLVDL